MICNRVAILDKGDLRYCGPVANIGEFLGGADAPAGKPKKVFLFQVVGDPQTLHKSFESCEFKLVSNEDGVASVKVTVQDQADVNGLIDQLRGNGVSIVGLEEQRVSLEDAFLQLID